MLAFVLWGRLSHGSTAAHGCFLVYFFVLGVNAGFGGQDLGRKANEL